MKTAASTIAIILISFMVPVGAGAQQPPDAEPVRTRFYDFSELELDGDRVKPNVQFTDARQRARFERLFTLARSFLPELRRTGDGVVVAPVGGPR